MACQANPGPAPVEEPTTATTTATTTTTVEEEAPKQDRETISIGIDPIRNGFNPHLLSDDSPLVRDIASLVLPSAFDGNQLNTDLLDNVEQVDDLTVRYTIAQEAQWSDGTPITGADFEYLRKSIVAGSGTLNETAYSSISKIETSGGGKTVDVIFSQPIADWHVLFQNLLPSHLIAGGSTFQTAFYDSIPASAGRYMVRSIDRQRGVITLSRNDRFWGENPAHVEMLQFNTVASPSRAGEYLRTGQSSFMNLTPQETLVDTLNLVRNTDVRVSDTTRTLELVFNAEALAPAQRAYLTSLIDVPLTARLAGGRSSNLGVAETVEASVDKQEIPALRLAADPADDAALAAARAIVDMLAADGIKAQVVTTDLSSAIAGDFDAVVAWTRNATDSVALADRLACGVNLAKWCAEDTTEYINGVLAGDIPFDATWEQQFNASNHLRVPILRETRVEAKNNGILGAADGWPGGISSAASWRKNDVEQ
ncbi:ABC transporter family substrate-binding protein [Corynebacterium suranareeae]|uniref:ABC transporter family substrate-binding protein n=1 Tax=Corynebacterium suranareeae TaxID=2506452 RepID=UPI001E411CF1|nr:ABC transporter family substrate-binding protein [Corynebacterium suranareeae]